MFRIDFLNRFPAMFAKTPAVPPPLPPLLLTKTKYADNTLLAAAAMSAFALSNADLVAGLASILSTASFGGLRIRMSRFNSLRGETTRRGW